MSKFLGAHGAWGKAPDDETIEILNRLVNEPSGPIDYYRLIAKNAATFENLTPTEIYKSCCEEVVYHFLRRIGYSTDQSIQTARLLIRVYEIKKYDNQGYPVQSYDPNVYDLNVLKNLSDSLKTLEDTCKFILADLTDYRTGGHPVLLAVRAILLGVQKDVDYLKTKFEVFYN